jgi:hypothetical protein
MPATNATARIAMRITALPENTTAKVQGYLAPADLPCVGVAPINPRGLNQAVPNGPVTGAPNASANC